MPNHLDMEHQGCPSVEIQKATFRCSWGIAEFLEFLVFHNLILRIQLWTQLQFRPRCSSSRCNRWWTTWFYNSSSINNCNQINQCPFLSSQLSNLSLLLGTREEQGDLESKWTLETQTVGQVMRAWARISQMDSKTCKTSLSSESIKGMGSLW